MSLEKGCLKYMKKVLGLFRNGISLKGHWKRSVKMSVLFIKSNFSHRFFFSRNKVTEVLKLALLASHIDKYATALIGNLQNVASFLTNKYTPNPSCGLYYKFDIVIVKLVKWCVVLFIIV